MPQIKFQNNKVFIDGKEVKEMQQLPPELQLKLKEILKDENKNNIPDMAENFDLGKIMQLAKTMKDVNKNVKIDKIESAHFAAGKDARENLRINQVNYKKVQPFNGLLFLKIIAVSIVIAAAVYFIMRSF